MRLLDSPSNLPPIRPTPYLIAFTFLSYDVLAFISLQLEQVLEHFLNFGASASQFHGVKYT